jgi:hypothetical protein
MRGGEVRAGRREGLVWWRHDKRHAREKGPTQKAWGPRARAELTVNMSCMSLTLEVSKPSGWLKAFAFCRVGGRACDAGGRGAGSEAGGPVVCGGTQEACMGMA